MRVRDEWNENTQKVKVGQKRLSVSSVAYVLTQLNSHSNTANNNNDLVG